MNCGDIYGFDRANEKGNCTFRKTSTENFLHDLASSRAVIATAGFSLLSESLYFKKPMLLMPVREQYEQILNSLYIEKLGLGQRTKSIDSKSVGAFVQNLDLFTTSHEQVEWPDNEKFFTILDQTLNKINCPLNLLN